MNTATQVFDDAEKGSSSSKGKKREREAEEANEAEKEVKAAPKKVDKDKEELLKCSK